MEEVLLSDTPIDSITTVRKDVVQVRDAQKFFISLGLTIGDDGFVVVHEDVTLLERLHTWHEDTSSGGIDMPPVNEFYKKVLLAVSLWRQRDGSQLAYLLGKGVGVEIALRGSIAGKVKRNVVFPYRSHSDFELYAVNTDLDLPYSVAFRTVFGNQEFFHPNKTKGLKDLPPTLLEDTHEVVDLGGVSVLIPELELLFLDKYMERENTPRNEGIDAILLAEQYELDVERIHLYLNEYVINPGVVELEQITSTYYDDELAAIARHFSWVKRDFASAPLGHNEVVVELNRRVFEAFDSSENRGENYSGIRRDLWEALESEWVDQNGIVINEAYLQRLKDKVNEYRESMKSRYLAIHGKIDLMFSDIQKKYSTVTAS